MKKIFLNILVLKKLKTIIGSGYYYTLIAFSPTKNGQKKMIKLHQSHTLILTNNGGGMFFLKSCPFTDNI